MKYLFKRKYDQVMILGDTINSIYPGQLWICPTVGNFVELRLLTGTSLVEPFDVTTVKKEDNSYYANIEEFNAVAGTFFRSPDYGLCNAGVLIEPSNTVNLVKPSFIQVRGNAGDVKVTDVEGNVTVLHMDAKEATLHRVIRVWLTGTTATEIFRYS